MSVSSPAYRWPAALAGLALAYAIFYWGYMHVFDGDHGRWFLEVSRVGLGEIPYKDVPWQYPPLSIYLYGYVARWLPSTVSSIFTINFFFYCGICVAGFLFLSRALPKEIVGIAALASLTSALYRCVSWGGAPLSAGTYSPAQMVGGLTVIFLAERVLATNEKRSTWLDATLIGSLTAGAVFSKQDFWPSALFLLFTSGFVRGATRSSRFVSMVSFALCFAIGIPALAFHAGPESIRIMLFGYNQQGLDFLVPPIFTLLSNLFLTSTWCATVFFIFRFFERSSTETKRWSGVFFAGIVLGAVGSVMTHPEGRSFAGFAKSQMGFLLPIGFFLVPLVVVARRGFSLMTDARLQRLAFFTLLSIAARSRFCWGSYPWYAALFDIPMAWSFVEFLWQDTKATRSTIYVTCTLVALVSFGSLLWNHPFVLKSVSTRHGVIRLKPLAASHFEALTGKLNEIDPSGTRAVLPMPYQGLSYALDRPRATDMTQGFYMTSRDPQRSLAEIVERKPIILLSRGQLNFAYDHHVVESTFQLPDKRYEELSRLIQKYTPLPRDPALGPWEIFLPNES